MRDLTYNNYGDEIQFVGDDDEEYFDLENFFKSCKSTRDLPVSTVDWTKKEDWSKYDFTE